MKKVLKYILKVVLPLAGFTALLGSCANTPCNNDSCYNRNLSSVDPYDAGDVADWGTEKDQQARERQMQRANRQ